MKLIAAFVASILVLADCQAALAYMSATCPSCRAIYSYGNCPETSIDSPPKGGIAFVGIVLASIDVNNCGTIIRAKVTRSSAPSFPSTILIEVGACLSWRGNSGDAISGVVLATPLPNGAYRASNQCSEMR